MKTFFFLFGYDPCQMRNSHCEWINIKNKNPLLGIWWKGFKTNFVMWLCFFQIQLACSAICGSKMFSSPIKSLEPTKIKWKNWFWTCFLFVQSLGRVKPTLLITRSTIHPWFPSLAFYWIFGGIRDYRKEIIVILRNVNQCQAEIQHEINFIRW